MAVPLAPQKTHFEHETLIKEKTQALRTEVRPPVSGNKRGDFPLQTKERKVPGAWNPPSADLVKPWRGAARRHFLGGPKDGKTYKGVGTLIVKGHAARPWQTAN